MIAVTFLSFSSCKQDVADDANPSTNPDSLASVETTPPNTTYRPAFAGQTRIGGVRSATSFTGKVLTESLRSPWGITSLPDGRLLITEKAGTMRIATQTGQLGAPITGIPSLK